MIKGAGDFGVHEEQEFLIFLYPPYFNLLAFSSFYLKVLSKVVLPR